MSDPTILMWLLIGLVAGVLAGIGSQRQGPGGFVVTILIGIAGALLGGSLARSAGLQDVSGWLEPAAALAGAVTLLLVAQLVIMRRTH